ncbi:uncharacterized protein F4807DRAFT_234133 [Annulohypoxylon truncatum]|uniref:uncharacterized protein n=1 Tax=Annulohypoxylon truncatum TaxID=327061 RepID=UPI00200799B4|nr:uncharacterized protein F4807DRAFT_234133 [Annulohypoxylon truncatum]KAI1206259.1 hypothetical protein F4807DRAFT_234133 [Annulohypoxylon truncatum]
MEILKSCDSCKARKVRCNGYPGPCQNCIRRKAQCHFSRRKIPQRRNVNTILTTPSSPCGESPSTPQITENKPRCPLPELYVDRLLSQARTAGALGNEKPFSVKGIGLVIGNASLTFFSDNRLLYLSSRLRNDRVRELIQRISAVIGVRLGQHADVVPSNSLGGTKGSQKDIFTFTDRTEANAHIKLYFERVHPLYPFLDQSEFEAMAFSPDFPGRIAQNKALYALYHAVVALGCQAGTGGRFEPGKGRAWQYLSRALAIFPDLFALPDSLDVLQAMTAITVYSLNISCIAIEHFILSEASRRAQNLGRANLSGKARTSYHRAFWLLYTIEKITNFHFGRNSIFVDHDIVIPIPSVPDAIMGELDWFLVTARYARLLSKAMASLFSIAGTDDPKTYYLSIIDQCEAELEQWRMSIPDEIRPGKLYQTHRIQSTMLRLVALRIHLLYNSFKLSLCRATLHLAANTSHVVSQARQAESTRAMMDTSRQVLELTAFIDVEPNTPLWIMAGIPVVALFILFDLVVTNPKHAGTGTNLALLDMAGGHFSRIEYASGGSLPGSLIGEFAHIAREYVNNVKNEDATNPSVDKQSLTLLKSPPTTFSTINRPGPQAIGDTKLATAVSSPPLLRPTQMSDSLSFDGDITLPLDDTLLFPINDRYFEMDDEVPMGTDIMDLFNSAIDPFFNQIMDADFQN